MTSAVEYTNYTNVDAGYLRTFEPGDRLVRGHHGDLDVTDPTDLDAIAEAIFERHNRDDRPDGRLCPSLSVGDVVVVGEIAVSVARASASRPCGPTPTTSSSIGRGGTWSTPTRPTSASTCDPPNTPCSHSEDIMNEQSPRTENLVTVAELVELLQTFPPDAAAGVLTVSQAGIVIDVETAPVITVEQTIADDGTVRAVWITGVGDPTVPPPSLITWPCPCGTMITVDPRAAWPDDHTAHLYGPKPTA
jgi:hypothetical protein